MWQIYDTFSTAEAANACVERLEDVGYSAFVEEVNADTFLVKYSD